MKLLGLRLGDNRNSNRNRLLGSDLQRLKIILWKKGLLGAGLLRGRFFWAFSDLRFVLGILRWCLLYYFLLALQAACSHFGWLDHFAHLLIELYWIDETVWLMIEEEIVMRFDRRWLVIEDMLTANWIKMKRWSENGNAIRANFRIKKPLQHCFSLPSSLHLPYCKQELVKLWSLFVYNAIGVIFRVSSIWPRGIAFFSTKSLNLLYVCDVYLYLPNFACHPLQKVRLICS